HSRGYFDQLENLRRRIVKELKNLHAAAAVELCEQELAKLRNHQDLFEPQKTQYQTILRAWIQQCQAAAFLALKLVRLLDSFNRHVFRRYSETLMAAAIDLAMTEHPTWLLGLENTTTFSDQIKAVLPPNSVTRSIYDGASTLVDQTQLESTLLAVAY